MKWNIVAPFFHAGEPNRWINDSAPPSQHTFRKVPFSAGERQQSWHQRGSRGTPLLNWLDYWTTSGSALEGADGVITLFPQLALTTSIRRMLARRSSLPIVAWCFNLGRFPRGAPQSLARTALNGIQRFIVHSTAEVELISDYLGIPQERVRFVPLQRAPIEIIEQEEKEAPFVIAMGSANRDYATLAEAARLTGLPVKIVASKRCMEQIDLPANVTFVSGLSPRQCYALAQRARFSIIPLTDTGVASGQVTVVEAQRMRSPVIATNTIGTRDYIEHGETGLLVLPGDSRGLANAMLSMWHDENRRAYFAESSDAFARTHLSDEAAGKALVRVLNEVTHARA